VPLFKGAISELSGKVFVSEAHQATKYDDAYKSLLSYLGTHFDHRVHQTFEQKDEAVGLALLTKPVALKKTVRTTSPDPRDVTKTIIISNVEVDKDSEEFYEYQHELKKYIDNKNKDDMQKCFTIIYGQRSPDIEQLLRSENTFETLKTKYDSIGLIKLIEKLCYNYHAHK